MYIYIYIYYRYTSLTCEKSNAVLSDLQSFGLPPPHGNFRIRTHRSRRQKGRPKRKLQPSDLFCYVAKSLTIAPVCTTAKLRSDFFQGGSSRSAVLPSIWRVVVMFAI